MPECKGALVVGWLLLEEQGDLVDWCLIIRTVRWTGGW